MNKEDRVPKSKINKAFSRSAYQYNEYNVIQAQVATYLISTLETKAYHTIIDMGCGAGEVYANIQAQNITFKHFIALDFSTQMLAEHPENPKIQKQQVDFNQAEAFELCDTSKEDIFLSSSALQWSRDLDFTFSHIAQKASKIHLALFTSKTFETLHKTANISSPIYSVKVLEHLISKYYDAHYEIKSYKLYFDNVREMFAYIKKSGVSGGEKRLSFKETKELMKSYPLEYLEFEVLFVRGRSLTL